MEGLLHNFNDQRYNINILRNFFENGLNNDICAAMNDNSDYILDKSLFNYD